MLKKYTYIYRSMRESLQDLEVVHSRHQKFFQSNYFNQAKLAIADAVNKFIYYNKISRNVDYSSYNVRRCIISGLIRATVVQSCRVMQSSESTVYSVDS